MEDVESSWTSEWQVVVGAIFYFGFGCMYCCIILPLQMCIGWLCCDSPLCFLRKSAQRENDGLSLMILFASCFLITYGTLKHSPALAVVLIIAHSSIGASCQALALLMLDLKKAAKVQQDIHERLESHEKEFHKHSPDVSTIFVHDKEPKVDGNEGPKELKPVSAYSDFEGCGLLECTLVFAVQMMLYIVLIASVFVRERFIPEEATDHEEMKFVGGAVIATLMALRGETFAKNEALPFWCDYFRKGYRKDGHWSTAGFHVLAGK